MLRRPGALRDGGVGPYRRRRQSAGKPKYQYWSDGPPEGKFDDWVAKAKETPGSWWPDWLAWLTAQAPEKVPARKPGDGKLKPLGDAPGDYVRVKA